MTSRDESIPIGTVSAEQIKQAREGAAALDLEAIEREQVAVPPVIWSQSSSDAVRAEFLRVWADRGALLAALRKARAEVERLRASLRGAGGAGLI